MIQLSGADIRFIILHGIEGAGSEFKGYCEPFSRTGLITVMQPTESLTEEAGII